MSPIAPPIVADFEFPAVRKKRLELRIEIDQNLFSVESHSKGHATIGDFGANRMIGELFDPKAELWIDHHYRPHWSRAGAIVFVAFRSKDSIPQGVIRRWHREKLEWMQRKGIGKRFDPARYDRRSDRRQ